MSRVLKVLDEILYKYEGIPPQGFDDGGLATPKRGLVDGPGSYSQTKPHNYFNRGIKVSETLDGKKSYYAKVKVGDEIKSFSDSSLEKVKKWKRKTSEAALKKGYEKRDMSYAAEQTKKQRAKEAKITAKARANIDKWTKNWLDKNLKNYGVRELGSFKKELTADWAKELKKNPNPYIGKSDFKPTAYFERTMTMKDLPNLTGSSISDKPFKYGNRILGDKLNIETTLNKIFYDNKLKDKNFKNKVKDFMQHYVEATPHGNNVVARKAYDSKTAQLLDDDVLYFLSKTDSKLDGATRKAVMETAFGDLWSTYRDATDKLGAAYRKNSKLIDEFLGGKNILHKASVKEHDALRKIFNVSKLPDALTYNIDHMYGISEAAREINSANPSKARVRAIVNNTLGMTKKRNMKLGLDGYSFKRKNLVNQINAGKNVDANLIKLNKATKAAYNIDNAYEIKQGKVTPGKSFVGQTRPERFKMYFEEIYKTKPGKSEIIKQHGSLKNLLAKIGCPDLAAGGRVGFQEGTTCFRKGVDKVNSGKIAKGTEAENFGKFLKSSGVTDVSKLRALAKWGIIPEAAFVAGHSLFGMGMGDNLPESLKRASEYILPGDQTLSADFDKVKRTLGNDAANLFKSAQIYKKNLDKLDSLKQSKDNALALSGEGDFDYMTAGMTEEDINKYYDKHIKEQEEKIRMSSVSADNLIRGERIGEEAYDISKANPSGMFEDTWLDKKFGIKGPNIGKAIQDMKVWGKENPPVEDESGLNIDLTPITKTQEQLNLNLLPDLRQNLSVTPQHLSEIVDRAVEEQGLSLSEAYKMYETLYRYYGGLHESSLSDLASVFGGEQVYGAQGRPADKLLPPGASFSEQLQTGSFAGGGIAGIRRPHAIPPKSGPMPQGGGLSSMFNRVRKW